MMRMIKKIDGRDKDYDNDNDGVNSNYPKKIS